ncbi:hypothetical protein PP2015_1934 [Pseudoalteromonas phenolica]|uniref:Uncharacterized protein n=1 Tax=Pseudoalteromonas phenolica TaxID=161398 RepID=A0A0S2K3A5_9GAMM|nr:hypothetical protein PP2015_1934 [Pseudoalteromonas phenolica]MBE0356470.1 hypothetical protein [Pseudoalteromonas phenolica O-BC30]TMO53387.1 hypothetical protein CWC21_20000 [Pseudoalteromonas phenolica]
MCLTIDLSTYQCPQLFVQFKFQLKQAQVKKQTVCFIYDNNQLINDILVFLETKKFSYAHHNDAKPYPFIEVNL